MEMKVGGQGAIAASPEEIWKVIFDPAFMSQVIPGCKDIAQPAEDEYRVKMVLGIPAVQGNYAGTLKILQKNPFDTITGSITGQGGLGKIDGTWEMQLQAKDDNQSGVRYTVRVDITGPMASMVGGFMEQVADALVKQGLESFNQAITGARENVGAETPPHPDAPAGPNLVKMIFRSTWDVLITRVGRLFKPKGPGCF